MQALRASGWLILLLVVVTASALPQSFGISWLRRYEYNFQIDNAYGIGADALGNVYVAGTTASSEYGARTVFLLKYSRDGALMWKRLYALGLDGYYTTNPVSLYVYPSGRTHLLLRQQYGGDYLLLTHDAEGNVLWTQVYDGTEATWRGDDIPYALGVDGAGNVYVTGSSSGYSTSSDITTVKYSANGQPLWVRRHSFNTSSYTMEAGTAIAVSPGGTVYVAGRTRNTAGTLMWVVLKYDTRGNLQWAACEEEPSAYVESPQPAFAQLDQESNLYVAGSLQYDLVVKKYSPTGNQLWKLTYSLGSYTQLVFVGAQIDGAGNLYVVANKSSSAGAPYLVIVLKVSPEGSIVWEKRITWSFGQAVSAMTLDAYGNLWVAGFRQLGSGLPSKWMVWQIDDAGNILREVIDDSSLIIGTQMVTMAGDPFGNVVLAGNAGYWYPQQSTPWNDIVVMKYGIVSGVELRGRAWLGDVALYPVVVPVEVELRQREQVVRRDTAYVDADGRFALYNVPPDVYDVAFKGPHWLRRVVPLVTIAPGAPEIETYLINGDIDGDNEVTLFDFGLLVQAFGSNPTSPNWNINADLDMDAEVTLFDFAVIVLNFGEIGDD